VDGSDPTMSPDDLRHLAPPITESRLSRQYEAVRRRAPSTPARQRAWAGWVVAAACAAVLAGVLLRRPGAQATGLVDGAVLESGPTGEGAPATSLRLADGSRVDLGASTRARLTSARPTTVRIDLERGDIEVDATHVDGRTFVVGAGAHEVRVVGTHFAVHLDPGRQVRVRVDRGAVDIASTSSAAGAPRRLAAGEQWSAPDGAAYASPPSTSAPAGALSAPVEPPGPPAQAAPLVGLAPHHNEGARDLFDEAQRARAEGRVSDAARAFDRLRRTFPRDPRAALAALELGRLRLDVLGDPRGAEEALRDAVSLGPSSPFLEDAEARRVEALGRMGDASGCAAARAAYLVRWPQGTYRRAVELGCGDR
jgi:hypothetical protein